MAYRPVKPLFVYPDNQQLPLAGGTVEFCETGTDDPKSVYSDFALTTNLGNTVTLDLAGRLPSDVWGTGIYRVRVYDVDGNLIDEADPIIEEGTAAGGSIPSQTGHSGAVLTTNGSVMSWVLQRALPDPTGGAGKVVSTDGTDFLLKSIAELGFPAITEGSGSAPGLITMGAYTIQFGNDTFPVPSITPPHGAAKSITFPTAFASITASFVTGNKHNLASHDYKAVLSCEATTTTLSVQYNINDDVSDAVADVTVTVPFSWLVIGKL